MHYQYRCQGTCAQVIELDLEDGKVHNVVFYGGCDGNHKGIVRLVEGQDAETVARLLEGTTCGPRPTSCPDQLSRAIRGALKKAGA